ncbi:MAG TPA: SgcJ/EcaC family oxidoreductase [Thermomicrobiales bacterium]|nr:SgcJ/EcaC family oxidoreductase [Thermomicrobiales bacterium]
MVNAAMTRERATSPDAERSIRQLYERLLAAWNRRSAADYAALFAADGDVVGFDGSPVDGRAAIEAHLADIFAHHETAAYVSVVREARLLTPDVALLRAVVGMIPPGQSDLNPAANAVQSLVASRRDGRWRIDLFHNTPAAFHRRPEECDALTEELRRAAR